FLNEFDRAMQHLEAKYNWLESPNGYVSTKHNGDKVIAFDRGGLLFVFNFHPTQSFTDYRIGTPFAAKHRCVLSSDDALFGGHSRIDTRVEHVPTREPWAGRDNYVQLYVPSRTVAVYAPEHY
ncbi:hypothetical protein HDU93_004363, partial [Gonapodya sp. JEL0774]